MRVGIGYDSHAFGRDRPLVLGGVTIPGAPGLDGFSDADAVSHAVTDAILGAAALGDIGEHFPPGDERWRDADSVDLLRRAVRIIEGAGHRVANVDVTVICEKVRIGPHAREMAGILAGALGIPPDRVSVKGKSNERMGWEGRGDGLAVHAVALLDPAPDPRE